MERIARLVRQIRVLDQRPLRLLAQGGAGLLFSALAGCGSVVASAPAAAPAAASGAAAASGTAAASQAAKVGCASVNQATAVTIRRANHLVEPQTAHPLSATDHQQSQVRALFGQMCAAVTHPAAGGVYHCPADLGTGDAGTFYDGSRVLALFTYGPTGCQQVSVTAAGKTMSTLLVGRAAAAAPHLAADVAAILGPEGVNPGGVNSGGVNSGGVDSSGVNPGGPDQPAT